MLDSKRITSWSFNCHKCKILWVFFSFISHWKLGFILKMRVFRPTINNFVTIFYFYQIETIFPLFLSSRKIILWTKIHVHTKLDSDKNFKSIFLSVYFISTNTQNIFFFLFYKIYPIHKNWSLIFFLKLFFMFTFQNDFIYTRL